MEKQKETMMQMMQIMARMQSGEISAEEAFSQNIRLMEETMPKRRKKDITSGVEEIENETWMITKSDAKLMATFTLTPLYIVRYKGQERYAYTLTTSNGTTSKIILTMNSMLSYKDMNAVLANNKVTAVTSPEYSQYAMNLLKYWTNESKFEGNVKDGTEHIGLVEKDGRYYYVSPNKVYNVETGEETQSIEYIKQGITENKINKMGNQGYNPVKWKKILKTFATNIHKINKKETILPILGWMTMLAHEYVVRYKITAGNGFPMIFLIGLPGSGKSATAKTLSPYLGWGDNEAFGKLSTDSEFGITSGMMSSYNVPVIYDEYGKPNPKLAQNEIDEIISASSDKTVITKGKSDLSSTDFEIKNSLMILGEQPPFMRSLQERGVIVEFDKSFVQLGNKEAEEALNTLSNTKDKNFFPGMVISQRQMYTNDAIIKLFDKYRLELEKMMSVDPRIRNKMLTIMVGLHCYIEMCKQNGLTMEEIGVSYEDILDIPSYLSAATANQGAGGSVLERLLETLDYFRDSTSPGNKASDVIGKGKSLFVYTPQTDTYRAKIRGQIDEKTGYMRNKKCIALNVKPVYTSIDRYLNGKCGYTEQDIRNTLKAEFNKTAAHPNNEGLVLCPQGFQIKGRDYALLDYGKVKELAGGLTDYLDKHESQ